MEHVTTKQGCTIAVVSFRFAVLLLLGLCLEVKAGCEDVAPSFVVCRNVDPVTTPFKQPTHLSLQNVTVMDLGPNYFEGVVDLSSLTLLEIKDSKLQFVSETAFESLKHLNHLVLTNDGIASLEPNTFLRLESLEKLNLKDNALSALTLRLSNVQELVLSGNNIVLPNAISGKRVVFLDLSYNQLPDLESSFRDLPSLREIDLSYNDISRIGDKVFKDNPMLSKVVLGHNDLRTMQGLQLSTVQYLDLTFNTFTSLAADDFYRMVDLDYLSLSHNELTYLNQTFRYVHELRNLNLSYNELTELPANLFHYNYKLETLDLSHNLLTSLTTPLTRPLEQMFHLHLSENRISSTSEDFFKSFPNLVSLKLSGNLLKEVTSPLAPLHKLNVLDLHNNLIELGQDDAFQNEQLSRLDLSSNKIHEVNFKYSKKLITVVLTDNFLDEICYDWFKMPQLMNLYLEGNNLKRLDCIKEDAAPKLITLEVQGNPLECDSGLDDTIEWLITKNTVPKDGFQDDLQAEWNKVKRELCPDGLDIYILPADAVPQIQDVGSESQEGVTAGGRIQELAGDEMTSDNPEEERKEELAGDEMTSDNPEEERKEELVEVEQLTNTTGVEASVEEVDQSKSEEEAPSIEVKISLTDERVVPLVQSGRNSWSTLRATEDDSVESTESAESEDLRGLDLHLLPWYTIAVALLGIALVLTIINIGIWMYLRHRCGRPRDESYVHLENEVYRGTTSQNKTNPDIFSSENLNRIFKYDKLSEVFLNFVTKTKDDGESVKQMIVTGGDNAAMQC